MITKKLLFFFFFCAYLSKINAQNYDEYEEDLYRWIEDIRAQHLKACDQYISNESFQELQDNLETDNEEIRAFRICVFKERKFIKNAKIDVEEIIADAKPHFPNMKSPEEQGVRFFFNICKKEAEQTDDMIDVIGRFTNCAFNRIKSSS